MKSRSLICGVGLAALTFSNSYADGATDKTPSDLLITKDLLLDRVTASQDKCTLERFGSLRNGGGVELTLIFAVSEKFDGYVLSAIRVNLIIDQQTKLPFTSFSGDWSNAASNWQRLPNSDGLAVTTGRPALNFLQNIVKSDQMMMEMAIGKKKLARWGENVVSRLFSRGTHLSTRLYRRH